MRVKLTIRAIEKMAPGQKGGTLYTDTELRGFCLVVYPSGEKVFKVRYRTAAGRQVRLAVGYFGVLTVEQAREKAREILSAATLGGDPAAERAAARRTPTWGQWVDIYLSRVRLRKKRPEEDARYLCANPRKDGDASPYRRLRRRWENRPIDAIGVEEIEGFREEIGKDHQTASNRWLASVSACLAAAKRSGYLRTNPAAGLRAYKENPPRARVLSEDEMERLLGAVGAEPDPVVRAAFQLLFETGARVSEVLRTRWDDVDLDAGTWRIPSPKSGRPQVLPLPTTIVRTLNELPHIGPYIVAGAKADEPRHDLRGPWERAKERAGLQDAGLRLHDIRRSLGLHVARTAGLHVASAILRHRDIRVTERVYAPLGIEALRSALEDRATVVPFQRPSGRVKLRRRP